MLIKTPNERIDAEGLVTYLETNFKEVHKPSIDITGRNMNSFHIVDLPNNCGLGRMALFKNDSKLLIADKKNSSILIFDILNKKKTETIIIEGVSLKEPKAVYVHEEDVYVADWGFKQILIFDSNFKFKRKIAENIKRSNYLSVNQHKSEMKVLFISHTRDNEISLWDIFGDNFLQKVDIEAPRDLKFRDDVLFILSKNGIIMMNKNTLLIKTVIDFNDISFPHSLHLSETSIYLIGYSVDKNEGKSKNFYLFIFDNSNLNRQSKRIELTREISFFTDAVYLQNRIILCGNFQFDDQNDEEANQIALLDFQ